MKRIFLFLLSLILIIVNCTYSQNRNIDKVLFKEMAISAEGIFVFQDLNFTKNGITKIVKTRKYISNKEIDKIPNNKVYSINSIGKIVGIKTNFLSGTEYFKYIYSENGLLIFEESQNESDSIIYDKNIYPISRKFPSCQTDSCYSFFGTSISKELIIFDPDKAHNIMSVNYYYFDKKGRIKNIKSYDKTDKEFYDFQVFEYNESNQIAKITYYSDKEETDIAYTIEYIYNDEGYPILEIMHNGYHNEKSDGCETIFVYEYYKN